jgi:hypothetical protein
LSHKKVSKFLFITHVLAMTMSLPALSLDLISRKREMLLERVWKIAAISTISGMMPIAGYNLTADIELLQKEVSFYRTQLGK